MLYYSSVPYVTLPFSYNLNDKDIHLPKHGFLISIENNSTLSKNKEKDKNETLKIEKMV